MRTLQLFWILSITTVCSYASTLNTVYCYLDGINGGPPQSQTVTGVDSAFCNLTVGGGSIASSTTDDLGDFSVSAYSNEGFRDAQQDTWAMGTWTVPFEETITWEISFGQVAGNPACCVSFTGAQIPQEYSGEFEYTATFQAGAVITAYAQGDGDGGNGSLTATVISSAPIPEPTTLIFVISGASLLVMRRILRRGQIR